MGEENIIAIPCFRILKVVPFLHQKISGHIHRFAGHPNVLYFLDRKKEKYTKVQNLSETV